VKTIPNQRDSWIQSYTGVEFHPFGTRPEEIRIKDIAHALALTCRFGGHCASFYSVAEHSVRVSYVCEPEDALWGLLHDASEAYLGDIPRPIKRHWDMRWFREREAELQLEILKRFGLDTAKGQTPLSVHRADETLLATEARDLMGGPIWSELAGVEPDRGIIVPWTWQHAERRFLDRFSELTKGAFL
jgi:hypothetical protein